MKRRTSRVNRGPAAAESNKQALLQAAREVFAELGYHAPLSAVAKAAGVGQGVLYRHFPTRVALAFAVFEENWARYETMSASQEPRTFERVWKSLVADIIESAAFIELFVDARRSLVDYDGEKRLRRLLQPLLERAHAANEVDPTLEVAHLLLIPRMIYGVIATTVDERQARREVKRALELIPVLAPRQ